MNKFISGLAIIILMISLTSARAQNPADNDAMASMHTEGKIIATRINSLQSRVDYIRKSLNKKLSTLQVVSDTEGKIVASMQNMIEIDLNSVEMEIESEDITYDQITELNHRLDFTVELLEEI